MLFYENLEEIIFHKHEMLDVDELVILSGYLGPKPVSKLENIPLKTSVIYGMYGSDKISEKLHNSLLKLNSNMNNTDIFYSEIPVHSKCYIWKKKSKIVAALIGSANFSINGLTTPYREILAETTLDTFSPLNKYLEKVLKSSINCDDSSVKFKNQKSNTTIMEDVSTSIIEDICITSLLSKGVVPEKSGLNWGLSSGHTTQGDAYIRISRTAIKDFPNLFPPKNLNPNNFVPGAKKTRQNEAIEIIWDDGTLMEGLLEQTQTIDGIPYPKAISSSPQKNILGIYIRNRLGVSLDHKITRMDLENYGRTTIDISLLEEGVYYFDFSTNKK